MIVVVPCVAALEVTILVPLFIVATEVLLLPHVPPAAASLSITVAPPVHSCVLLVIGVETALTIAVIVAALPQPLE